MEPSARGKLVAHNVFARKPHAFDDRIIPGVTFTGPELARVGMTEADLQKSKLNCGVGRVDFKEIDRAVNTDETCGSVKLLAGADGNIPGGRRSRLALGPPAYVPA